MGSGIKKEKFKNEWDYYSRTEKDDIASVWCLKNNIRVSYRPLEAGMNPTNFKVSVGFGPPKVGEKLKLSPTTYKRSEIIEAMYKVINYYYDKYK